MKHSVSVNQAALATVGLTDLMYQHYCYKNGMPIYLGTGTYRPRLNFVIESANEQERDWHISVMLTMCFERLECSGGNSVGISLLYQWILEVFTAEEILSRIEGVFNKRIKYQMLKQEWERDFDREEMASQFVSDDFCPAGEVHYRYVYHYSVEDCMYKSQRYKVGDFEDDFWEDHKYWFDYYGPEEDEVGLINYLDY
ncbi:hypothetical protein GCM10011607_12480 [Shewanella inventionis]|uniref:Uncharacterized protein n=1 Tax=Shewanella inventionis TaxID=1738770 RepID=A0ABQ1IXE6_9GAMM|nr:hypothetical protein [Shewanella inventionis]GGB53430.1 hypothetical protein GCM10011607_12480 [Shewanella inventionis]